MRPEIQTGDDDLEHFIDEIIAQAPKLTDDQLDRLRALLAPAERGAA